MRRAGRKIKAWYVRLEHYISPLMLIAGFTVDNLTLRRVDLWAENLIIIAYLVVALGCIFFINAYSGGWLKHRWWEKVVSLTSFLLQLVFGGLFSAFFVFYFRSSSFLINWPFLFVLAFLLIGNEVFYKHYSRLVFQLSLFFVSLFSYSVFSLPIIMHQVNSDIFILSGILSLLIISYVIAILYFLEPKKIKQSFVPLLFSICGIYLVFNIFYFTNIIPPIPLALKESGVYHNVQRTSEGYIVEIEPSTMNYFFKQNQPTFHWQPGTPVYFYSAVFSPSKIDLGIYHQWFYYDEQTKTWVEKDKLGFSIVGGRDGGYRGYSFKYQVNPGKWRIDVVTEEGRILGRNTFMIVEVKEPAQTVIETR